MSIDTNRLVEIATQLKGLDRLQETLLAELQRVAGGAPAARRGGRPPTTQAVAPRRRGRPPGSKNKANAATPASGGGGKRRKGLTTDVLGVLADGGSHTAGDIVEKLKLQPKKGKIASVGATLFRLVKEGRVKKDKVRGYRAA